MAWYGIVYHIAMAQLQPASRSVGDVAAGVVESRIRIGVDMMTIVREDYSIAIWLLQQRRRRRSRDFVSVNDRLRRRSWVNCVVWW
ncbi:uncharacterized protein H6S33_008734 [Morchella sextelata]|uniref:uncharacterized protein n=1 Tax=Morchella sextelata TaxID=1174677 RepID=UPI001D05C205|nr:uncharacterized protein H6S33_008734 [Morchella sextelata]KAH0602395.1 hypothetical protein H6S33_008734 [Morchella sextelata]